MSMNVNGPRPLHAGGYVLLVLLGAALAATLVVGFVLGRWRLWGLLLLLVPTAITATLFWYLAAMLSSSDPTSDTAAAAGAFFLLPFLIVVFTVALAVPGLLGHCTRHRLRHASNRSDPTPPRTTRRPTVRYQR
jgi:hypothetical protein